MEGWWRVVVLGCCALALAVAGCGETASRAGDQAGVRTSNPERAFAPLIELAADEPWRPMSARWFIERSSLWYAGGRCEDREIAVGHALPERQTPRTDWIFPKGLGGWSFTAYFRNPYDGKCVLDFDRRYYADQFTRPYDPGRRVQGIPAGEGFYLDLIDGARSGPPFPGGPSAAVRQPVYADRVDEGDGSVRLRYWMLFGMRGTPGAPGAHEGDWLRVDVLLRIVGEGRYQPLATQVVQARHGREAPPPQERAWATTRLAQNRHPAVRLQRGTHVATIMRTGEACDCRLWPAWWSLSQARKELWYGFGGAWGELGATSQTTGSLGPHRFFPSVEQRNRERAAPDRFDTAASAAAD